MTIRLSTAVAVAAVDLEIYLLWADLHFTHKKDTDSNTIKYEKARKLY